VTAAAGAFHGPLTAAMEARVSQSSKRPGAKDISDLKARLGLKKSGPAAGKAGGVAPPGARAGGVIPAPPGAQPPRPHIPDAKEDPFGAMNALAAHGATVSRPAEIVIVQDDASVERVQKKARARLFILGGVMIIPLIVGIAVGRIASGATAYNRVIDDAGKIREDVKKQREGLIRIQQVLVGAKERGRGKLPAGDPKLTAELAALPALNPNIDLVFSSYMYDLKPELVAATLTFYVNVLELNDLIKSHVKLSKDADRALKKGQENITKFLQSAGQFGYGGLIETPSEDEQKSGAPPKVKIVQLGAPVCEGDKAPSEQGCGSKKITGFRYRPDESSVWGVKKAATAEGSGITTDALVALDFNKALLQLVQGGEATVAESNYTTRIGKIEEKLNQLIESEKGISSRLNNKAEEKPKFTFFM
jgi:hypothetical protein